MRSNSNMDLFSFIQIFEKTFNEIQCLPVHSHNNDCSEDDGKDDKDGDQEVEVHVEGGERPHKLHVTVLLRRFLSTNNYKPDGSP